jgi:hypothetical protein
MSRVERERETKTQKKEDRLTKEKSTVKLSKDWRRPVPRDGQERRSSRSRVVLDGESADEPLGLSGIADGGAWKQLRGGNRVEGAGEAGAAGG